MSRLDDDQIARARDVDLVALVGRYVPLSQTGVEWKALCPFHKEKTPSFFVVPAKGFYYCHGCGAGGNAINFARAYFGLGFREAVEYLTGESTGTPPACRAPVAQAKDAERDRVVRITRA